MTAFILAAALAFVLLSGIFYQARQKRKNIRTLLARASRLGTANNLSFSSQEVWTDRVIGLDGIHRKLAILTKQDAATYNTGLIDLDEVAGCSVKKNYGNGCNHPEKISLHFAFLDGRPPVDITFFQNARNRRHECRRWERKAMQWSIILSKMLLHSAPAPHNQRIFPPEPANDPERSATFINYEQGTGL